jgi:hemolysin D
VAFRRDGEDRAVQPGMSVQADVTTDRRRVIEFFLSPVVKYMDAGLKSDETSTVTHVV